jgi:hypothetical protein
MIITFLMVGFVASDFQEKSDRSIGSVCMDALPGLK